jgi:hypothetical protein
MSNQLLKIINSSLSTSTVAECRHFHLPTQVHGVAVLGTIITEWEAGRAIMHLLLSHEDKMAAFIEKCAQIAEFHGFQVGYTVVPKGTVGEIVFWTISLYPRYRIRIRVRQGFSTTYEDFIGSIFQPCEMAPYISRKRTKCKYNFLSLCVFSLCANPVTQLPSKY